MSLEQPRLYSIAVGDVELCVHEWPGAGDPVLMLHATGFHSRCWGQVVEQLSGMHVYAVDLRFHGGSSSAGEVDWLLMSKDIQLLIERLDLQRVVGVGHSIGGFLIARAAAALPSRFKQVLLLDPVIMSPETYSEMHQSLAGVSAHDHPVSRRKNQWQDSDEMFQRFRDRHPFSSWQESVLRDYCDYALKPNNDSDYLELACDPLNEALIYLSQQGNECVHDELPTINTPVTLLRAPPAEDMIGDLSSSPTWPELARHLPVCREVYLPELNHFIPMQDPALVASYIRQAQEHSWQLGDENS